MITINEASKNAHELHKFLKGEKMTNLFVSPTRRYVIVHRYEHSSVDHLFEVRNLSELYVNDVSGAVDYYKDKLGSSEDTIISCIPYEVHLEHILAQEKLSRHVLVSPSRSYAIYVEDSSDPAVNYLYLIVLPKEYDNDEIEAVRYLNEKILPDGKVSNCLTYEMYLSQPYSRQLFPYHATLVAKPKDHIQTGSAEWDCVKLVKRYSYRENRPDKFLFALPRIMVKGLEDELTRQANIQYHEENPDYKYGDGYGKENHYCVVFQVAPSGSEEVVTYYPYRIFYRKVTVFFTDLMAIFGTGLENMQR